MPTGPDRAGREGEEVLVGEVQGVSLKATWLGQKENSDLRIAALQPAYPSPSQEIRDSEKQDFL